MTDVVVWFDGGCPLCRREIALMRRLDRRGALRFIDVSTPQAGAACPLDPAEMMARFHVSENGQVLSGAAAFAAMWRAVPLLRPLGLLARNERVLAVMERLYAAFLRRRSAWRRPARSRSDRPRPISDCFRNTSRDGRA